MTKAVLDANIGDTIAQDDQARERIRSLCEVGELEIVVPDTLARQLEASPFGGVPDWFPTQLIPDSTERRGRIRLISARRATPREREDCEQAIQQWQRG